VRAVPRSTAGWTRAANVGRPGGRNLRFKAHASQVERDEQVLLLYLLQALFFCAGTLFGSIVCGKVTIS
jgi:hypothetical protein